MGNQELLNKGLHQQKLEIQFIFRESNLDLLQQVEGYSVYNEFF